MAHCLLALEFGYSRLSSFFIRRTAIKNLSLAFSFLILIAHALLGIWGLLGFIEYTSGSALIIPLQNPNFPAGMQFIHWVLATGTGFAFLVGYFTRLRQTPFLMIVCYACLTTLCFVETFDFMTKESRYTLFAIEVVEYIVISIFLFQSNRMKGHFAGVGKSSSLK